MPPLKPSQLGTLLLLRRLSPSPPPPHSSGAQSRRLLLLHSPPSFTPRAAPADFPRFPRFSDFSLRRNISSAADAADRAGDGDRGRDEVARSLSAELTADADADALSVVQRLALNFSHVTPDPGLVLSTLNLSADAGRTVLGFYQWLGQNPGFTRADETLSMFVDYFGRRKDFKAIDEILSDAKDVASSKTLESVIDRLVRAGRSTQAVGFFERMERDYGLKRDKESMKMVVEKLCEKGYANCAEKMVKSLAHEFFPDEHVCDLLIKGWCVDGKLEEANRLAREMYRGGFEIGTTGYNSLLDCVCKLCRKKDPFRLNSEAEHILVDMDYYGVPRNVETFNVLIGNLCKIRKTEDAMKLFHRMGEWGCYPNKETFLVLIKSLYQAARVGEGDEMIDRMKSAGYVLDKKAYYGFLKILSNALFNEALRRGVPVEPKAYRLDPRYMKKPKAKKKAKTNDARILIHLKPCAPFNWMEVWQGNLRLQLFISGSRDPL
ncbi:hypothetical protein NL676_003513 [Syzygium grande]|nr:hypothetical protein NL676_003513 [Syzygium grande]